MGGSVGNDDGSEGTIVVGINAISLVGVGGSGPRASVEVVSVGRTGSVSVVVVAVGGTGVTVGSTAGGCVGLV